MSVNAGVLQQSEIIGSAPQEAPLPVAGLFRESTDFNSENFAYEQIRGLVRRIFFPNGGQPTNQVVFSAIDPSTDVSVICDLVGQILALETIADIAIVCRNSRDAETTRVEPCHMGRAAIRSWATKIGTNLWHVPEEGLCERSVETGTGRYWISCLAELRNEFEYAIIQGPPAGISSEAALLGQLADGIILVLGAQSTRGAAARKIKETLEGAQSRILGAVLSERLFPVPEKIYRRL